MHEALRLNGLVAIVTGASRGLGRAMAYALAEAGAHVALASRNAKELEETAQEVSKRGVQALVVPTDVTHYAQVESMADRVQAHFGQVDILVNNSGIAIPKAFLETTLAELDQVIQTNLYGVLYGCRAVGRYMVARKRGKIINIASMLGGIGMSQYASYCASKAGVVNLTRALALEWARHNVQVNAIAPGWFLTPMNAHAFADPTLSERILRDVPARRTGRPEELGPLVVYLASRASDFMTGQTIFIDGGQSAH